MAPRQLLSVFLMIAACSSGVEVPDQAAADDVAKARTAELVAADADYRLIRLGTADRDTTVVAADPMTSAQDPRDEITPVEPSWLFLIDLAPDTFFGHPVQWLIVGESGDTTTQASSWWPLVNGLIPDALRGRITDQDDDVVEARVRLAPPGGVTPVFSIPNLDLAERNAYLVVQGLLPGEPLYDDASATGQVGRDFFETYQDGLSETIYLADGAAGSLLATIHTAATTHATVTIAIIAHGSVDRIGVGGYVVSAQQLRQTFLAHPGTRFNLLLGSCHGGSFVNDLSDVANVDAVLTAVDAAQGAVPDWDLSTGTEAASDVNIPDVGSEWFSSMYAAAAHLTASNASFAPVRAAADAAGVAHSTALLCLAFDGAIGQEPTLGLGADLDFSHVLGGHSPQRHCVVP